MVAKVEKNNWATLNGPIPPCFLSPYSRKIIFSCLALIKWTSLGWLGQGTTLSNNINATTREMSTVRAMGPYTWSINMVVDTYGTWLPWFHSASFWYEHPNLFLRNCLFPFDSLVIPGVGYPWILNLEKSNTRTAMSGQSYQLAPVN